MSTQAYERYLDRLYSKRAENPELEFLQKSSGVLTEPFKQINRKTDAVLYDENASIGARLLASARGQLSMQSLMNEQRVGAEQRATERRGRIDEKIDETQMRLDEQKEIDRKAKAAKNTGILRGALSIAGMAAGAALAPFTGGLSMVAGMSIGGALGSAAGGFMGINEKGNFTLDPEEWDMGATVQGIQEAGAIYSAETADVALKEKAGILSSNTEKWGNYIKTLGNNDNAIIGAKSNLDYIMKYGTLEELQNYFNTLPQ